MYLDWAAEPESARAVSTTPASSGISTMRPMARKRSRSWGAKSSMLTLWPKTPARVSTTMSPLLPAAMAPSHCRASASSISPPRRRADSRMPCSSLRAGGVSVIGDLLWLAGDDTAGPHYNAAHVEWRDTHFAAGAGRVHPARAAARRYAGGRAPGLALARPPGYVRGPGRYLPPGRFR